jgi:hypothetical protein
MNAAANPQQLFASLDAPFASFAPSVLGDEFGAELRTVSELWFRCGYQPGVAAYLNFFLLHDFITLHDARFPPRFANWQAMAKSFYETDLFIRAVTDSGRTASGGISSPHVRALLGEIMGRHQRLGIPTWMMSYFGWSLFEAVETRCAPLTDEQRRLHLAYMARTYRLMGVAFANDRVRMSAFARAVEARHAAASPRLLEHARAILRIGELIGVRSHPRNVLLLLPAATRTLFAPLATAARPGWLRRVTSRVLGPLLVPRAVGKRRVAVPWSAA